MSFGSYLKFNIPREVFQEIWKLHYGIYCNRYLIFYFCFLSVRILESYIK
jgi:hypothetical protein